jgi:hypothetical protein
MIFCLFNSNWNPSNYLCDNWSAYSHHLTVSDRFNIAKYAKRTKDLLKQEIRSKIKSSKDRHFQVSLISYSI